MERKLALPQSLFQWFVAAVVAALLLGFLLGTRMLFVAGAIILLGFALGVGQSAIKLHRDRSDRTPLQNAVDLLPHVVVFALVAILLYVVVHEFLRTTGR